MKLVTIDYPPLTSFFPRRPQHPYPVFMGDLGQRAFVEAVGLERFHQFGQTGGVFEIVGHGGAIEVGAEGHMVDADAIGDVGGVAHNLGQRSFRVGATIFTQETDVKVDANYAV